MSSRSARGYTLTTLHENAMGENRRQPGGDAAMHPPHNIQHGTFVRFWETSRPQRLETHRERERAREIGVRWCGVCFACTAFRVQDHTRDGSTSLLHRAGDCLLSVERERERAGTRQQLGTPQETATKGNICHWPHLGPLSLHELKLTTRRGSTRVKTTSSPMMLLQPHATREGRWVVCASRKNPGG